jgi:ribosomal protein S18 acetylase RimI-like enzyme
MGIVFEIAGAVPDEYEWCARLMASTAPWTTLGRSLADCRATLFRLGCELFVARRSEAPIGFILLSAYGLAASPYVASIAVSPETRGKGVGSQLLRFAEQRYADRGHIFLLVSSSNPGAQELYRRHGYQLVGELKDYVAPGASELIMHKRLP